VKKDISINEAVLICNEARSVDKKVVLAGGCFDILHQGHVHFLSESKKAGDVLIVLLESDENIKRKKGNNRPINSQKNRLKMLSALTQVDFIIPLRGMTNNQEYDKLIVQIKPDVITITEGDKKLEYRKKQANSKGARLFVVDKIKSLSTTEIARNI
jgi:rfaE bifunctional protein nucleotidyltransferase chain/domain